MQEIIRTLAWTFIHSLWQGMLAALLTAIILNSTKKTSARLRYNLLGLVLLFFLSASIITFIVQWSNQTRLTPGTSFPVATGVSIITESNGLAESLTTWVNANATVLLVVWSCFFLLYCLRLVTGLAAISRLCTYKVQPVDEYWKNKLEQLKAVIGVHHSVTLLQSGLAKVPVALGILRPVILIPVGLINHLPAEQVETILLHELAHIRRKDYLVNVLQHITEAVFFFNPALRWISSLLRQEREACCDDMVVTRENQKINYLQALVNFQEYSYSQPFYGMGITTKRQYLLNRVKRLVNNKNKGTTLFEKLVLLCGIILFSAFSFALKEKKIKHIPIPIAREASTVQMTLLPQAVFQSPEKERKVMQDKIVHATHTLPSKPRTASLKTDTVPAKTATEERSLQPAKPLANDRELKQAATHEKLKEIQEIKDRIGAMKEIIGQKKAELKNVVESQKRAIMEEINTKRKEIENSRKYLDRRRYELEDLQKMEAGKISKDGAEFLKPGSLAENRSEISSSNDISNSTDNKIHNTNTESRKVTPPAPKPLNAAEKPKSKQAPEKKGQT